ncbi:uncharacterized protein NEMAJ01_1648 [Nematocida major]|uniref:uncharacterized protein n=1 Tax=Nematocida major TaxID=1912982 RepID=UPI002008DB50|nr:uncharacterized protein NEMAJ01_1648 [Nematocida major]KAH9386752.1 hypothetical protein NEMAJ01_1648 [Nematocida major]
MNLRIPIGFITLIIAMIMSAFVVFDLTRHMGKTNDGIIEALLDTRGYPGRQNPMPFANDESNTKRTTNMGGYPGRQYPMPSVSDESNTTQITSMGGDPGRQNPMPFANDESNTKRTTSMGGDPERQYPMPSVSDESNTTQITSMGEDLERKNYCISFVNEEPGKYVINEHAVHGNASCFVKDIFDPLSKVDLKIYSRQFGANETSEIQIKYKLLNGESMRNNFAEYQKNCIFDYLEPIVTNYVEMSKFACFAPEPAYTNFYANIIGDRRLIDIKSRVLKGENLAKVLYFGRQSCLWSKDYYLTLRELVYHGFYLNYDNPDLINARRVKLLGGIAFVYDAVKFNTFSTMELMISRYQQTLKAFEEKNSDINLKKLAAVQLRTDAYSLIDSLALIDYIAERITRISEEHDKFVNEGSISAAVAGTREVHALDFSIMDSLNSSTFGKDNIFTKQKFIWQSYKTMDANVTKALQDEIKTAWESPKTCMDEDLEALRDLLKMLKTRLGTDQTSIVVKGMPLDKVSVDSVEGRVDSVCDMLLTLHNLYDSASNDFEDKIMDSCKNKTSDCLPDMHEYKSMPDDPMKGTITLENHRSAYEEALAHNDSSPIPASNPGTS